MRELAEKFPAFITESEVLLSRSKDPASSSCADRNNASSHSPTLVHLKSILLLSCHPSLSGPSGLIPLSFRTKICT